MYRIELTDADENLISMENYNNKIELMIHYKKIVNNMNIRYKLHGLILSVYEGQHCENLKEIKKYKVEF